MDWDQRLTESFQGLSDDAFLRKAYLSLLGRQPDAAGGRDYLARLQAGIPRIQIWSEIAAADEAKRFASRHPSAAVAGRLQASAPSPAAVPAWAPAAAWAPQPSIHSVNDLLSLDGVEFVRSAYREILGREADAAGLRDYSARLASGTPKEQLLADLRCDPEGRAKAAPLAGIDDLVRRVQSSEQGAIPTTLEDLLGLHGERFVRAAYLVLFKREPDRQGLERYLELLRSGVSTMHVLKALYEAPEAREKSAKLAGLKAAIRNYDKAQQRNWTGWYYRSVIGAPSELPRDRELRALAYRLSDSKR